MKKNVNRITREELIKMVAKNTYMSAHIIDNMLDSLEAVIFEIISSASEEEDVSIRLFEGLAIEGIYQPEKNKTNNLTGEVVKVEGKIKPRATFTRTYRKRLGGK